MLAINRLRIDGQQAAALDRIGANDWLRATWPIGRRARSLLVDHYR